MAMMYRDRMLVDNGHGPQYEMVQVYRFENPCHPGTYGPPQRDLTPYEANEVAKVINATCRATWELAIDASTELLKWRNSIFNACARFMTRLFG